jgi:polar amino acid transport system permease protein
MRPGGTYFYVAYLGLVVLLGTMLTVATGSTGFVPILLRGLAVTIEIASMSAVLALIAALVAGLPKAYAPRPVRVAASCYIEVFRGTSALVQLFWLFFVIPNFGIELPPMAAGVLALGLNVGAYGAEIIRGAVLAVPRSQWDASIALGLPWRRTMWRIIFPQAAIAILPSWGNLMIELIKSTSLVSLITLADLAFRTQQLNLATYRTPEIYGLALLMYLALSLLVTIAVRLASARLDRSAERAL